jgi:hypothetical protein
VLVVVIVTDPVAEPLFDGDSVCATEFSADPLAVCDNVPLLVWVDDDVKDLVPLCVALGDEETVPDDVIVRVDDTDIDTVGVPEFVRLTVPLVDFDADGELEVD